MGLRRPAFEDAGHPFRDCSAHASTTLERTFHHGSCSCFSHSSSRWRCRHRRSPRTRDATSGRRSTSATPRRTRTCSASARACRATGHADDVDALPRELLRPRDRGVVRRPGRQPLALDQARQRALPRAAGRAHLRHQPAAAHHEPRRPRRRQVPLAAQAETKGRPPGASRSPSPATRRAATATRTATRRASARSRIP